MAWTRNAWNNFKAQPEIWFFYGFILISPLSIRKVFFDYPVLGEFNEYSGIYLYLSDVFLGLTILTWLISILYNNSSILSINRLRAFSPQKESSTPIQMFPVEHPAGQAWNFLRDKRGIRIVLLGLPALLVLWSSITIFWSDQPQIALYRSFKLFEFYLLYLFLAINPKCSTWNILRNVFRIIIAAGLINTLIGILQVILQHSLGLFWLKESLLSPNLPGVAKVVLGGVKYIRAYGLFPHPNILGGFLLMSILLTLAYRRLFHLSTNVPHGTSYGANVEQSESGSKGCLDLICLNFKLILGVQIVAGILTFSKSAIFGLTLTLAYMYRQQLTKMFHMEHFKSLWGGAFKKVLLLAVIVALTLYSLRPDFSSIFIQSLTERLVYLKISLNMITGNFLAGIGSGQFVLEMQKYFSQALLPWQMQPVHNVFLLIWSELGLIGLSLFSWFLWKLFHPSQNVPRLPREDTLFHVEQGIFLRGGTFGLEPSVQNIFKALLIGFFAIALFDHYLWDIQQGQIVLWTALGLLAGIKLRS